jgi:hypothetical protein
VLVNGEITEEQFDGYDFENQLIFRNYHKITRFDNLGFGSPRFGVNFESDDPGSPGHICGCAVHFLSV